MEKRKRRLTKGMRRKKIAVMGLIQLNPGMLIYYSIFFFTAATAFYRRSGPAFLLHKTLLCSNENINGKSVKKFFFQKVENDTMHFNSMSTACRITIV